MATDHNIIIIFSNGFAFIGKPHDDDPQRLDEPRAIVMQAGPIPGQMSVMISPIVGAPKWICFNFDIAYCVPTDPAIVNAYIEQVSGIKLANVLPIDGKQRR